MRVFALILLVAFLGGCSSTGLVTTGTSDGIVRLADARPATGPHDSHIVMSQSAFRGLALIPETYGQYSCRRNGGINYCVGPRDIYADTLECRYTRNGKWHLSATLRFPEAYICRGTSYPKPVQWTRYEFQL